MRSIEKLEALRDFVANSQDVRPQDGVYQIDRSVFTEPELFDVEMEFIFEKVWIYACHESELPGPNHYVTVQIGRQPIIVTRDAQGALHAMVNACAHRGATLVRQQKGRRAGFTCSFHGWTFKMDGALAKVKAPDQYGDDFEHAEHSLRKARVDSYKGFVFVCLDNEGTESLEAYLGDARVFLDMMVEQSPSGELEVVPGRSQYTYDGNWKLQCENGLDGYHVSTVHFNYVSTVKQRQDINTRQGRADLNMLDLSKLGTGDAQTDDGFFSFHNGHSILFSVMPNPEVRPGYRAIMARLVEKHGQARAEWVMHRLRNLNIYPSLFFMDQMSTQLRVIRPLAWNKTEIISYCIAVKGESPAEREQRIRQFEDFFNVSGMGTPDDLVEFREAQRGFQARLERWNDSSRGHRRWLTGESENSRILGIKPVMTGTEGTQEGLYLNQHGAWKGFMLDGLDRQVNRGAGE